MLGLKGFLLFVFLLVSLFGVLFLTLHFFSVDVKNIQERNFISDFFIFRLSLYFLFLIGWYFLAHRYVMFVHDILLAKRKLDPRLTKEVSQQYTDSMIATAETVCKPKVYLKIVLVFFVIELVMIRQFTF